MLGQPQFIRCFSIAAIGKSLHGGQRTLIIGAAQVLSNKVLNNEVLHAKLKREFNHGVRANGAVNIV